MLFKGFNSCSSNLFKKYRSKSMDPLNKPFCPTFSWKDENGKVFYKDTCLEPTDISKIDKRDIALSFAIPNFGFDCKQFLKNYYDLYSFESVLEWLSKENNSIGTQLRIMNCAWSAFINKEQNQNVLNDELIEFYSDIIRKIWIKDIYNHVFEYISVDKNNILLKKNKDVSKYHKIEKINFFLEKFNNKSFIYNVLKSFITTKKSKWDNIKNYNDELKTYYIDYVINKIKITLS